MKLYTTLGLFILSSSLWSQSVTDVLLFTQENLIGTARYTGMAGAFGAIGGDLSAITDNPAAATVFSFSEMGFSSQMNTTETKASYFSNQTLQEQSKFRFSQFGLVLPLINPQDNADWTKIAFAFNSRRLADFSNKINAIGQNNQQNLGDYFTYYANGLRLSDIEVNQDNNETVSGIYEYLGNTFGYAAQQGFLGYQAYAIDPLSSDPTNESYTSTLATGSVNHDWILKQNGGHQKYNFALSARYRSFLDIGAAINSHRIQYDHTHILNEASTVATSALQKSIFINNLSTHGTGVSAQMGLIARLPNAIQLGFSYQSPTWLRFEEETTQSLETEGLNNGERSTIVIDPKVTNVFPAYRLQLPAKVTASAAYIIKDKGLLSFSYSRRNMQGLAFTTDSQASYLGRLNQDIETTMQAETRLQMGAEWRLGHFLCQAGYQTANNPLKAIKEASQTFGAGIQYDLGGNMFGLSWLRSQRFTQRSLYSQGLTSAVALEQIQTQIVATYLLKL